MADATVAAKFPGWDWTIKASDGYVFTAPVGEFRPNAFGLYDMHGNAWQWCADYYRKDYYGKSPADDPKGPDTGTVRVLRGGSWNDWAFKAVPPFASGSRRTNGTTFLASALPGIGNAMVSDLTPACGATLLPIEKNKSHAKPRSRKSFLFSLRLCGFALETSRAARSLRRSPASAVPSSDSACTLNSFPSARHGPLGKTKHWRITDPAPIGLAAVSRFAETRQFVRAQAGDKILWQCATTSSGGKPRSLSSGGRPRTAARSGSSSSFSISASSNCSRVSVTACCIA